MPFAGFKDFDACVQAQLKDGKSEESAKKICGSLQSKHEKKESSFVKHKIHGTALKVGTSRNGNNYTEKHIKDNSNKEVKLFYGDEHVSSADNVLGKVKLFEDNGELKYDGWIINTNRHPDAIEQAREGLLDVSISAIAKEEDVIDIRNLHLVASPGVEGASAQVASMVESFNIDEEDEEEEIEEVEESNSKKISEIKEGGKMEDQEKVIKENEELRNEVKCIMVESILDINPNLNKEELMKESLDALKIRKEYEKKNVVKESEKKEEVVKSESIVETEVKTEETKETFIVDKYGGVGLSESAYRKFNDDIKKFVRGE